jgi:hypothetical protein
MRILHDAACPGGDTVAGALFANDMQPVQIAMVQPFARQADFPDTLAVDALQGQIRAGLPVVQIAQQVYGRGFGRPFPQDPLPSLKCNPK